MDPGLQSQPVAASLELLTTRATHTAQINCVVNPPGNGGDTPTHDQPAAPALGSVPIIGLVPCSRAAANFQLTSRPGLENRAWNCSPNINNVKVHLITAYPEAICLACSPICAVVEATNDFGSLLGFMNLGLLLYWDRRILNCMSTFFSGMSQKNTFNCYLRWNREEEW